MTKSVQLGSFEHGLRECFHHLGVSRAAEAVEDFNGHRKSESLLRKYADPDNDRHQVPMRDALAMDRACIADGHQPPMLTAYRSLLERATNRGAGEDPANGEICHLTLAMDAAAGLVSEAVLQSEICDGSDCHKNYHTEQIYASLRELEDLVTSLRKAVVAIDTCERQGIER